MVIFLIYNLTAAFNISCIMEVKCDLHTALVNSDKFALAINAYLLLPDNDIRNLKPPQIMMFKYARWSLSDLIP